MKMGQLLFFLHKLHMYILTPHYRTSLLVIRQAILQKSRHPDFTQGGGLNLFILNDFT